MSTNTEPFACVGVVAHDDDPVEIPVADVEPTLVGENASPFGPV